MNRVKKKRKNRAGRIAVLLLAAALLIAALVLLYHFGILPHGKYDGAAFGIETYRSAVDRDGDGIDDQTDILLSVKAYLETKPVYKSAYYSGGWPDDGYGVCTDVVARGLLGAGYDLQELIAADREARPENYAAGERPDRNIDFRRVRNLLPYFKENAISLTTDTGRIAEWQPGDIVVWEGHVGVISEHRNFRGIPFVYHHRGVWQAAYEEDVLTRLGPIVGHFRIS